MKLTTRQKEIISASIELIAEKGIQELTIKNLSKKIGTAESATYRHFKSKMDILLAILGQFKQSKMFALEQVRSSNLSELEQVEMIFRERFKQFAAHPAVTAVIFSEEIFQNDKRLADEVYAIMNASQNTILNIIKSGQKNGLIRDDIEATEISLTIIGALRLIVIKWRLSGFAFDLQVEGAKLWQSLKRMIEK